jgi:voltage-gated sodium channel
MTAENPDAAAAVATQDVSLRARAGRFINSDGVRNAILAVIVINAICLGLYTDAGVRASIGTLLRVLDIAVTLIFVAEIALKLYADRLSFFRDGWNVFDFLIVFASVLTLAGSTGISVLRVFRVLRVVRVLRVLRIFSVVSELRRVVEAFLNAIPGMSAIIAVLLLLFYVSAVITTDLFGRAAPDLFGSIGASFFTLFQIMTGDGWSEVVRELDDEFPLAWLFFVPFITITSFAVLNMFIAVIVDSLQREQVRAAEAMQADLQSGIAAAKERLEEDIGEVSADVREIEDAEASAAAERREIMASIAVLREELRELRESLGRRPQ